MVVVAIVGILAALAVPNYQKYQSRSRQSEAKIALSAIFTSEKSFLTEQSTYTACLKDIGFSPDTGGTGIQYYALGFDVATATNTICGPTGTDTCAAFTYSATIVSTTCNSIPTSVAYDATARANVGIVLPSQGDLGGSTVTQSAFSVQAIGSISTSNAAYDIWSVDQNKRMVNVTPIL